MPTRASRGPEQTATRVLAIQAGSQTGSICDSTSTAHSFIWATPYSWGGALPPGTILTEDDIEDTDPGYSDAVRANGGPLDVQPPILDITSPSYGASFLQGQNLPVVLTATDNVALAAGSVNVRFDVDGSGAIDATGETLVGTPTGNPNQFTVTFTSLAGPNGVRKIDARASDTPMSNVGQDLVPVYVPEPSVTLMLLIAVPFLAWCTRKRPISG